MSNKIQNIETQTAPQSSHSGVSAPGETSSEDPQLVEASALGPFLWLAIPLLAVMTYGFFSA